MKCKYCLKEKEEIEFYSYNRLRCKACCILYVGQDKYKERKKKYQKKYYSQWYKKNGRKRAENYVEIINEWKLRHPTELRAQRILQYAIRTGHVIKPITCMECNKEIKLSGHHPDYKKPLEVLWLCSSCHKLEHVS